MTDSRFFTAEQVEQLNIALYDHGVQCKLRKSDGFVVLIGKIADPIERYASLGRMNATFFAKTHHVGPVLGKIDDFVKELEEVKAALVDLRKAGFKVGGLGL